MHALTRVHRHVYAQMLRARELDDGLACRLSPAHYSSLSAVAHLDDHQIKKSTPYGQLPVLYIDGKPMTQSLAMLRYVGRLAPDLYPPDAQTDIDCAIELVSDFEQAWGPALYLALKPTE